MVARETWLRPNRRALSILSLVTALLLVGTVVLLCLATSRTVMIAAAVAAVPLAVLLGGFLISLFQPRLAYRDGQLLVYLRRGQPIQVPIEIVECFFLGQGDTRLPSSLFAGDAKPTETATVVVRLAESAQEWKHVDVLLPLGQWCEGYITVRGTWCEPLTGDLVKQMNHRLVQVQRDLRRQNEQDGS